MATPKKPVDPSAANGKPSAEPADLAPAHGYFRSLSIENVRCFGPKQTLDLSDGNGKPAPWTIILGLNGTGKTTLLQALMGFEEMPRLPGDTLHMVLRYENWASDGFPQYLSRPDQTFSEIVAELDSSHSSAEIPRNRISFNNGKTQWKFDSPNPQLLAPPRTE